MNQEQFQSILRVMAEANIAKEKLIVGLNSRNSHQQDEIEHLNNRIRDLLIEKQRLEGKCAELQERFGRNGSSDISGR